MKIPKKLYSYIELAESIYKTELEIFNHNKEIVENIEDNKFISDIEKALKGSKYSIKIEYYASNIHNDHEIDINEINFSIFGKVNGKNERLMVFFYKELQTLESINSSLDNYEHYNNDDFDLDEPLKLKNILNNYFRKTKLKTIICK